MALDGSNQVQLSEGPVGLFPVCARGADEVIYTRVTLQGKSSIWRVPLEGGESVMARELQTQTAAISPDGRTIAGGYNEGQRQSIAVFALDSQDPPQVFPIFPRTVAFAPDGRALTYIDDRNGVGNVWAQPLPSGTPAQLTSFASSTLYNFAWSHDGRRLALSRGSTFTDVILFSAK
jgi:Tol biopolymer transport system component